MRRLVAFTCFAISFFTTSTSFAVAAKPPGFAIASASSYATEAGMAILEKGGNAFDAAVTLSSVLAVTEPYHSGLGGGGFWLLHLAKENKDILIDGREVAPLNATKTMYQNANGEVDINASLFGAKAAAIPGEPAALAYISQHYGKLPLKETLAPAIFYAKEGFKIDAHYLSFLDRVNTFENIKNTKTTSEIFLDNGQVPKIGSVLKQENLAKTLETLALKGHDGFYKGAVAKEMVLSVNKASGIWQLKDLENYQLKIREPLVFTIGKTKIVTAPLPSAGGLAIITILRVLDRLKINPEDSVLKTHALIEAMRLAFWDRANFLGDGDFIEVPMKQLLSEKHIKQLSQWVSLDTTLKSQSLNKPENLFIDSSHNTTHFSVIDKEGNMVSATLSINYLFGSGFVAGNTGVLLNDEMDDFSNKIGQKNIFGLVGHKANSIEPLKRPLSSMAPTFLFTKNRVGIIGTPGGSRIPTMLTLATLAFMDGKGPLTWVGQPRFHHQYLPDITEYEADAFDKKMRKSLKAKGHILQKVEKTYGGHSSTYGDMQVVFWDKKENKLQAVSDFRHSGLALVQQKENMK